MSTRVPKGFPGRVDFMKSAAKLSQAPHHAMAEICVCGRSNVGKSSLINTLCNRRQLARVSSTPGRTQLINFFNVQDRLVIVDLPGYGWAKVPKSVQKQWGSAIEGYLGDRRQLMFALCLMDLRREPGHEEKGLVAWFAMKGIPTCIVATKCDKVAKSKRLSRVNALAKELGFTARSILPFSSHSGDGKEALWNAILTHTDPFDTAGEGQDGD